MNEQGRSEPHAILMDIRERHWRIMGFDSEYLRLFGEGVMYTSVGEALPEGYKTYFHSHNEQLIEWSH